jgi:3-oxoacyl-[acyl-carrier protein] reductase
MQLLNNKKALITGGTSGIGKAIAIYYAANGADVVILGTNALRGQKAVEEIEAARLSDSQKVYFYPVNVSKYEEVERTFGEIFQQMGRIDILVNNAGIVKDSLLMKMKKEEWDEVINVNLSSIFYTCKLILRPMLKEKNGKIINISSIIGLTGNAGQANYAASKSGMIGFTKSLAKEVARKGICVNCIAPGYIETRMTEGVSDKIKEKLLDQIPMRRIGSPSDIAEVAVFLGSNMANYITGQVITVDGGMVM